MNMRIIEDITNFIFVDDTLEKADVVMIPGSSYFTNGYLIWNNRWN